MLVEQELAAAIELRRSPFANATIDPPRQKLVVERPTALLEKRLERDIAAPKLPSHQRNTSAGNARSRRSIAPPAPPASPPLHTPGTPPLHGRRPAAAA